MRTSDIKTFPKHRSHTLPTGRHSIGGTYYHILIVTNKRRRILSDNKVASIIFQTFDSMEAEKRLEWVCIMVMPDHGHAVIRLGEKQTLAKVLHAIKRYTAREINKQLATVGAFWQKGYTDSGIRDDAALNETLRYCYANPVGAGIVEAPRDYPHWRCKFQKEY